MPTMDRVADGQAQGRHLRERDGGWGEARSPRADTVILPSISLRREQGGGGGGGAPPAQGRAEGPTAQMLRREWRGVRREKHFGSHRAGLGLSVAVTDGAPEGTRDLRAVCSEYEGTGVRRLVNCSCFC